MIQIKNEKLLLSIDERGRITSLVNLTMGDFNIIKRPVPLFKCVFEKGNNGEEVCPGDYADMNITSTKSSVELRVTALHSRKNTIKCELILTVSLDGERVLFDATVNNTDNATLVDFFYPCVGAINSLGGDKMGMYYPAGYGEYFPDILSAVKKAIGRDTKHLISGIYPFNLSMQFMMLSDGERCLCFSVKDEDFHIHAMTVSGSEYDDVTFEPDKMIFVSPGESKMISRQELWFYRGAWQSAVEDYRRWANGWRKKHPVKDWVKNFNGSLSVFSDSELGDHLWQYNNIPKIYELASRYGCDLIELYGYLATDHSDLDAPVSVIEKRGGTVALKSAISEVNAKNGKVVLNYPGHTIKERSEYYREHGDAVILKNHWGNPYYEMKPSTGTTAFLKYFGEDVTAVACPGNKEWQKILTVKERQIADLGANGVTFDTINLAQNYVRAVISPIMCYPCFNSAHNHKNPSSAYAEGRRELYLHLKDCAPDGFAIGAESQNDIFSQNSDYTRGVASVSSVSERDCSHNGGSIPGHPGERAKTNTINTRSINMPELLRHAFPEDIGQIYCRTPYIPERSVNYALCYGFRLGMQINTRKELELIESDKLSHLREYAAKISDIRLKYASLLLNGRYSCDPQITAENSTLNHGVFTNGDKSCVVLWNDTEKPTDIHVTGRSISAWETVDNHGIGVPEIIPAGSVMILFE